MYEYILLSEEREDFEECFSVFGLFGCVSGNCGRKEEMGLFE